MTTEPKIYLKNYLDTTSGVSAFSGAGTKTRIFDRDRDIQWSSSGQGSDSIQSGFNLTFLTPAGVPSPRSIDTVILLNHNFSDILIQSSTDGSTYSNRATGTGPGNNILSLGALISAPYWNVLCIATNPSNQEKKIAEIILTSLLLDPGVELDSYDVSYRQMAPEIPLADGSIHRTVVKWTESRSAKYEFSGKMSYLTFTQLEALRVLKESGVSFYWQPESVTSPQEIYLVNWTGPFRFRYMSTYKVAGYQVEFQFKEV